MNGSLRFAAPLALALSVAACNAGGSSGIPAASGQSADSTQRTIPQWEATHAAHPACKGPSTGGWMQCLVLIDNHQISPNTPGGWGAPNIEAAYDLPSTTNGKGQIVAIVDAYDNPDVATDVAEYRTEFGLPAPNFTKYNQKGQQSNYPVGNASWGVEIALDVEMVSAVCPLCTIYLIEADSNSSADLDAAELEAVKLGAHVISNSWGGTCSGTCGYGADFSKPGVTYTASAGDSGYGSIFPAQLSSVVSVGGTILHQNSSGGYYETVWPDSGGGCSTVTKPSWQKDPTCTNRTQNDVSAIAFWFAEYDTYDEPGWFTVRGTSVASPMIAGVYGLAGNARKEQSGKHFWLDAKKLAKDFHTNITGSIVGCPSQYTGTYVCNAGTGQFGTYGGPAGWGSPNGIAAF